MVVAHRVGSFGESISRRESIVLAMEIGETGCDQRPLNIEPRAGSYSIASIHYRPTICWRSTEVSTPSASAVACSGRQFLAMGVCAC
jgi:hypothetical protein